MLERMARPQNKDGIRAKVRTRDGIILIHLAEYPGHWIVSPERDRGKAITWAKRNRDRLVRRADNPISFYCQDFYLKDSLWVRRQKEKGHTYSDLHLLNRHSYLCNYFSKAFGHLSPQDIDNTDFRREFDNWLLDIRSYRNEEKNFPKQQRIKLYIRRMTSSKNS